jgi:hypothetical protein
VKLDVLGFLVPCLGETLVALGPELEMVITIELGIVHHGPDGFDERHASWFW